MAEIYEDHASDRVTKLVRERRSGGLDDRLFRKRMRDFSPKELERLSILLSRTPGCSDGNSTGTCYDATGFSPSFSYMILVIRLSTSRLQCLFQVLFQVFHIFDSY
jgi:hypothetical protein